MQDNMESLVTQWTIADDSAALHSVHHSSHVMM